MMRLEVNGEPRQATPGMTLEQLIVEMALGERRLAVEYNLEVIPRSQYAQVQLKAGDRIEIVHAIGGG